jgi:16S rRNA (adenine1518-N6/adenine1519-N6)-dimethyltransferase
VAGASAARVGDAGGVTLTRTQVGDLLARHGLEPSRALGQNFVADPNTVRRIVRLAGVDEGDRVVEIGPGVGSLTTALAEAGARVTAVELDRHLLPVLEEVVGPLGVRVVHGDALTVDWDVVLGGTGGWSLVANLPYNVATTVVLHLLDEVPGIESMLVMVQREVAERLAAPAGSRTDGIPSVKVATWAEAEVVGRVPSTVFVPQPRVESALVRLRRRREPLLAEDPELMMQLVRRAFGQRRKMLRRSLAGVVAPEVMERAGIDPASRPEQLAVERWVRLADALTGS